MKIIKLTSENVLRLKAVEITPTGAVVRVTGRNGQGKTSVLDSIYLALDQRKVDAAAPIHKGAKKATIKLNLGEITVERVITPKGSDLKVTAADGTRHARPQDFLNSLLGELSFDPQAFDRMKPLEQFEQLRRVCKVTVDFDDLNKKNQADFDRRTEVTRQAKQKRAQAEGIKLPQGLPEPIDEKPILEKIRNAQAENDKLAQRKLKRQSVLQHAEAYESQAKRLAERIAELREQITKLDADRREVEQEGMTARAKLAAAEALPEPVDVGALTNELVTAQGNNAHRVQWERRKEIQREADELEQLAAQLTEAMDQRNQMKADALTAAKLPVEGLTLGEGEVLMNGYPYSQASSAERLRIGMLLAMLANPEIRVIRIQDGSLLDSQSLALIGQMAKENDFQVWIEEVDETGQVGIVIEDGMVAKVNE